MKLFPRTGKPGSFIDPSAHCSCHSHTLQGSELLYKAQPILGSGVVYFLTPPNVQNIRKQAHPHPPNVIQSRASMASAAKRRGSLKLNRRAAVWGPLSSKWHLHFPTASAAPSACPLWLTGSSTGQWALRPLTDLPWVPSSSSWAFHPPAGQAGRWPLSSGS